MAKKKTKGWMRPLMIMSYKGFPIMVRKFGKKHYLWDVVVNNQFFSSYLVMEPIKGKKSLNKAEVAEVVKMCYAGAASTVDNILGIKLSDSDEKAVKMFENATRQLEDIN